MTQGAVGHPDRLLRLLDPDPAVAEQKYKDLFRRLMKFFQFRHCDSPEDLAQDTMVRVFERSADVIISAADPAAFFQGFANNILHEARREAAKRARRQVSLHSERVHSADDLRSSSEEEAMEWPPAIASPVRGGVAESRHVDMFAVWRQRLWRLQPHERELLVEYYGCDRRNRRRLAAKMKLTEGALRTRVCRYKASSDDRT